MIGGSLTKPLSEHGMWEENLKVNVGVKEDSICKDNIQNVSGVTENW